MESASETDPISPVEIEHDVEFTDEYGRFVVDYNFLNYHFESAGAYCWARTYLDDEIHTVSVYGPFKARKSMEPVEAPELRDAVMAYLKRRFFVIQTPGSDGLKTIWQRGSDIMDPIEVPLEPPEVSLELDQDEALVLFDFLGREIEDNNAQNMRKVSDRDAHLWALNHLYGVLETKLTAPFAPNYDQLVKNAEASLVRRCGKWPW